MMSEVLAKYQISVFWLIYKLPSNFNQTCQGFKSHEAIKSYLPFLFPLGKWKEKWKLVKRILLEHSKRKRILTLRGLKAFALLQATPNSPHFFLPGSPCFCCTNWFHSKTQHFWHLHFALHAQKNLNGLNAPPSASLRNFPPRCTPITHICACTCAHTSLDVF